MRAARRLASLGISVVAPTAAYYLLRGLGVGDLMALLVSAVFPAAGAAWALAVRRRADGVAVLALATVALTVVVSVISRDPRFLLAKDGFVTGAWGLWFAASVRAQRPAAFTFARPLLEGRRVFTVHNWDGLWEAEPGFRRIWRVTSLMWAAGLAVDAAIRVVMSYTLPVHDVPALGAALWPATFVVLQVVTNVYCHLAGLNRMLGNRLVRHAS